MTTEPPGIVPRRSDRRGREWIGCVREAYARDALALEPAEPIRRHITDQIAVLRQETAPHEETR
jgi:hypothetical protein